jgi:hypothetical protein
LNGSSHLKPVASLLVLTIVCGVSSADCFPTFAVKLTWPARASAEIGLSTLDFHSVFSVADGFVIRAEPGLAGGKLHAGLRHQFTFVFLPLMTWDYTLSAFHTWGDPWGDIDPGQTYLGIEAQGKVNIFLMSMGVYWHVAGDRDDPSGLFSGSVGVGF